MAAEGTSGSVAGARKRRLARLAGCAAVVAVLGLGMAWGGRVIEGRQAPAGTAAATGPRLQSAFRSDDQPGEPLAADARTIDATNSNTPRDRFSGLERTAPRAPLGPSVLAAVPPKEPAPVVPAAPDPGTPRPTLLFGAVATAAGRIEAVGHVIELEGVAVVDPARQCEGQGGSSWPCGAVARSAFRAWLRGRAVECTVTPQPLAEPVLSLCRLGGKDMASWLVANGLAEATPGSAYEQAGQEARAAHRGIFGDRPRALPMPSVPVATALDGAAPEPVDPAIDAAVSQSAPAELGTAAPAPPQ